HGAVVAARRHALAIRRERRAPGATLEDAQLLAGVGVPQPQRLVLAARQHALAVCRYADAPHWTLVAGQDQLRPDLVLDVGDDLLGAAAHFQSAGRFAKRVERRFADFL